VVCAAQARCAGLETRSSGEAFRHVGARGQNISEAPGASAGAAWRARM
jgi:hypothetical protein